MIKLKNLIKEIAFTHDNLPSNDDDAKKVSSDTPPPAPPLVTPPPEVIDVVHKIEAVVVVKHKEDINEWIDIVGPFEDKYQEDNVWIIRPARIWEIKNYWCIGYYVKCKHWKLFFVKNGKPTDDVWIDEQSLDNIIDHWVKGL